MHERSKDFRTRSARPIVAAMLLVILTACADGDATDATPTPPSSTPPSSVPDSTTTPFPESEDPVAFERGTYSVPASGWSVADFTITFPEGWTVQYGHVYSKHPDTDRELGFYAVTVDEIYADACEGDAGKTMELGPSVDDLAEALLEQAGARTSRPADTTLGNHPAVRIDLTVPKSLDLEACTYGDIGLQIWYSVPADKYFVLLLDGVASVYIVDVSGQRQVFLTQYRSGTSDADLREMQAILDSIAIDA